MTNRSTVGRRALVTGVTGQDGSYLAELLLRKGYEVHGVVRRSSSMNRERLDHLELTEEERSRLHLHYGDLADGGALRSLLERTRPEELYNLGAQSHVAVSFEVPEYTADVTGTGVLRLLEAMRETGVTPRFYQASSSELYGKVHEVPQRETTPFHPRSPYACAKAYAYYVVQNYREAYGFFACNGVLFNHESPRRGETFVTRKITRAAARISLGLQDALHLGNLDARRDWGYAPDYVEAMWLMLQRETPSDYVIATGETHSVEEFVAEAFGRLDLDWREHVRIDPRFVRPAEVDLLIGDPARAREELGWAPRVTFRELVEIMVEADLELEARLASREASALDGIR